MVFSGLPFLFAFLPAVLAVYYLLPKSWRNGFLFLSSLFFYAWGEPVYVLLMLFAIVFGFITGILLERWKEEPHKAKALLILSITVNLGILFYYKYGNFMIGNISRITGLLSGVKISALPLGISFYTFQTLSYIVDVYRGQTPAQKDILRFGAYIAMFPMLIAGPIVRYNTVADQLTSRRETLGLFGRGAGLFTIGLAKKTLLANTIGVFWDAIQSLPPGEMTVLAAWSGITAFGLQLYFDFSGYSDMAIGLGWMMGFRIEQNFLYPYLSLSVSEFWRRWHISLGAWFREYLYIPLGGSRRGNVRTAYNLLIVWAATGFWHGANWNFILWGLYYFCFLAGERFLWAGVLEKAPKILRHFYVLGAVMTGWALFVFEDMNRLGLFCQALLGMAGGGWVNDRILYLLSSWAFPLLAAVIGATPLGASAFRRASQRWSVWPVFAGPALMLAGLILSVAYLVDSSYNPFLYFRF